MRGWNHKEARHWAGNILRNLGAAAVLLGERIDPQPDVTIHPFSITTSNGTRAAEARITWHETA